MLNLTTLTTATITQLGSETWDGSLATDVGQWEWSQPVEVK